jgi:hypothetical protein
LPPKADIFFHTLTAARGSKPARAASSSPTRSASVSWLREYGSVTASCAACASAAVPTFDKPKYAAAKLTPTFFRIASLMRARPCSSAACAISWPITAASSSSVSFRRSIRPVNTMILPPGMQNALTIGASMTLTSHCH